MFIVHGATIGVLVTVLFAALTMVAFLWNIDKGGRHLQFSLFASLAISIAFFLLISADSFYCSTEDVVNLLSMQKVSIEVISKDKAILTKDGKNEFSYLELKTREDDEK